MGRVLETLYLKIVSNGELLLERFGGVYKVSKITTGNWALSFLEMLSPIDTLKTQCLITRGRCAHSCCSSKDRTPFRTKVNSYSQLA